MRALTVSSALFLNLISLLDDLRKDTSIKTRPRSINAMTCLMAYHNKKGAEAISIVLQTRVDELSMRDKFNLFCNRFKVLFKIIMVNITDPDSLLATIILIL
jgi:hypothetical protein